MNNFNDAVRLLGLDAYLTRENDPGSNPGTNEASLLRCKNCNWRGDINDVMLHWYETNHDVETNRVYYARLVAEYEAAQEDPRRS